MTVQWRSERGRNGGIDRVPADPAPGALWLCGKHLIGPDHEAALARTGARLVVCLNEPHELVDRYPAYVAWLRSGDPRVHWDPIPDMTAPTVETARRLVRRLRAVLDGGQDAIVHCGAGIGRAGTMAAAVLVSLGVAPDAAVDHIAAHRPMAGPERGEQRDLLDRLVGWAP